MPASCAPEKVVGANGVVYVGCTHFDHVLGTYGAGDLGSYIIAQDSVVSVPLSNCINPGGLFTDPDEQNLFVVCRGDGSISNGQFIRLATADQSEVNSFAIGTHLGPSAMSPEGLLFIADGQEIYVIDTANGDAVIRGEGNPIDAVTAVEKIVDMSVHPDLDELYVVVQNDTDSAYQIKLFSTSNFDYVVAYPLLAPVVGMASW
jgi:DNA-binding beta-propeller fold protein YncE